MAPVHNFGDEVQIIDFFTSDEELMVMAESVFTMESINLLVFFGWIKMFASLSERFFLGVVFTFFFGDEFHFISTLRLIHTMVCELSSSMGVYR